MGGIFEAHDMYGEGVVVVTSSGGEERATLVIALAIVFIAYFLHPLVEYVYEQIRAAYGDRDINRNNYVEVTPMGLYEEILRGRGKHRDKFTVSRLVAVLVALFVLASLGLELSLSVQRVEDGPAYLFNRPPPVFFNNNTNDWEVVNKAEVPATSNVLSIHNGGNVYEEVALARYHVPVSDTGEEKIYNGKIPTAWWSHTHPVDQDGVDGEEKVKLSFTSVTETLNNLECNDGQTAGGVQIRDSGSAESLWEYTMCAEKGPKKKNGTAMTPPTIILTNSASDERWLIMEENSSNPSFLYSVWKTTSDSAVGSSGDDQVDPVVEFVFYIASTTRMAEAIITGIVHGYETGRECVRVLWEYSANNREYKYDDNVQRALPFGEIPYNSQVGKVSEVETIIRGVKVDPLACACFLWLLILSMLGCAWTLRSRSRPVRRDIYDLAEVIKLVVANVSGRDIDPTNDSAVRIFVHKEDDQFVVTLEEAEDTFSPRALCRSGIVLMQRLGSRLGLYTHSRPLEGVDNYDHGTGVHSPTTTPPPAGAVVTPTINGSTDRPPRHVGTPARDIENNQDPSSALSSAARVPATTPQGAGAPPPGPNQQYRLCVQRFGEGRSFSDAPRGNGPAWSLTATPVSSAPSSPTDPSSPIRQRVQFAECNQTISMRLREGRDHLEMTEHSTAESSAGSPIPNSIPTTPALAVSPAAVHPDETEFNAEQFAPPAIHSFAISSSSSATIDDSSDAAETKISPPDDIASAAINHNNSPVLASVHAERQTEALEAQRASRAVAAAAAAVAAANGGQQRDVSAQGRVASGTTPNPLARSRTFRIAPRLHRPAKQTGATAATTATAVIADDSSATPASGAVGGSIPSSPPPSRRSLEAAPTLGPAQFNRLREASNRTVSDTDRSEGRQSLVRRQSTRRWWWRWG